MNGFSVEVDADHEEDRLLRMTIRALILRARSPIMEGGCPTAPGEHSSEYERAMEAIGLSDLLGSGPAIDEEAIRHVAVVSEEMGAGLFIAPAMELTGLAVLAAMGVTLVAPPSTRTVVAFGAGLAYEDRPADRVLLGPIAGGIGLAGRVQNIPFARDGDILLVQARTTDSTYLVLATTPNPGIELTTETLVDGSVRAQVHFKSYPVNVGDIMASGLAAERVAEMLTDVLLVSTAAQLVGLARRAVEMTVDHLQSRRQYGHSLGEFQALQHRAVDNLVAVEATRAYLYQVCGCWTDQEVRRPLLHGLLDKASSVAMETAKWALQMQGGMGFTAEHEIGWYLKFGISLSSRYGGPDQHRRMFSMNTDRIWHRDGL